MFNKVFVCIYIYICLNICIHLYVYIDAHDVLEDMPLHTHPHACIHEFIHTDVMSLFWSKIG